MKAKICALLMLLPLVGCAPGFDPLAAEQQSITRQPHLEWQAYQAVDRMYEEYPELASHAGSVVVGSVEDIRDVSSSTPFGNIVSEMVRTRLVQHGVNVQELRVRSSVLLERKNGEMLLSRDRRALLPPPTATEFVTGTYAVSFGKIYVSLKVIDARAGRIKAASDFVADRSPDVNELLSGQPL